MAVFQTLVEESRQLTGCLRLETTNAPSVSFHGRFNSTDSSRTWSVAYRSPISSPQSWSQSGWPVSSIEEVGSSLLIERPELIL